MEIQIGSELRDNDPRQNGKKVVVIKLTDTHAYYKAGVRSARVRRDRIHSDGRHRATGFNLVNAAV